MYIKVDRKHKSACTNTATGRSARAIPTVGYLCATVVERLQHLVYMERYNMTLSYNNRINILNIT